MLQPQRANFNKFSQTLDLWQDASVYPPENVTNMVLKINSIFQD